MQDVASYKNQATFETDKKVNIIYGLNGTGKSTISDFLYDQTVPAFQHCSADVKEDEKVLVYNQKFIHDHFYEEEQLKGVFSLSKENKEIEERLKATESDLAALSDDLNHIETRIKTEEEKLRSEKAKAADKTWEIKTQYTGGDRVLEYCLTGLKGHKGTLFDSISTLTKPDSKPSRDIAAIKKDVESLSGDTAQPYEQLQLIEFNEQDIEDNAVFSIIIVGNEDSPVSNLIKHLNNSDWVRKGLEYLPTPESENSEQCPFCQEKTITSSLAESIKNYFDESFEDSLNLISTILERYKTAAEQLTSIDSLESHPLAKVRLSELKLKYEILIRLINENIYHIKTKKSTPSAQVQLTNTGEAVKELNEIIEAINTDIIRHNDRINNAENEIDQLRSEFWSLMRWDYDQTISNWKSIETGCKKKIKNENSEKINCSNKIANKRLEVTDLQKSTVNIETAIESINNGLTQLGITDFFIAKHNDSLYRIQRQGETKTAFTSLSEGEKMIISFFTSAKYAEESKAQMKQPLKKSLLSMTLFQACLMFSCLILLSY